MARSVTALDLGLDSVPCIRHAAGEGPCVVVTANVHGDELNGVGAVQALDQLLTTSLVRGEVLLYPTLNPCGMTGRRRTLRGGKDLNRLFPGSENGSEADQHAHLVWSALLAHEPDVVLDLHSDSRSMVPYTILDRVLPTSKRATLVPELRDLADQLGLTMMWEYPEDAYLRYSLDRSLPGALVNRAGIAAVTLEAGGCGELSDDAIRVLVEAVSRVLVHRGMLEGLPEPEPTRVPGQWQRGALERLVKGGLMRVALEPGERFQAGDVLATVVDLEGAQVETVMAPAAGVLIAWMDGGWIPAGVAPGTIGVEEHGA